MSCSCNDIKNNGQKIADLVRSKGFENNKPMGEIEIICDCGNFFKMHTLVCKCTKCSMTFAVTPCSSKDNTNVAKAGLNY